MTRTGMIGALVTAGIALLAAILFWPRKRVNTVGRMLRMMNFGRLFDNPGRMFVRFGSKAMRNLAR